MTTPKEQSVKLFNTNFILISLAALSMFIAFYLLMPVIAQYLIIQFQTSSTVAGAVVSSYIITSLLTRPFSGFLVDTFDRRKFYLLTYGLFSFLFLGYLIANSVGFVLVIEILLGATFSMVTTAANTLAIDVLPAARRNEGIGYFGAAVVLAMAIGPMLGLYLIESYSYQWLFTIAFLFTLLGFSIACCIKTNPRPRMVKQPLTFDRFYLVKGTSIAVVVALTYFFYGTMVAFMPLFLHEQKTDINPGAFFLWLSIGVIIARLLSGRYLNRGLHATVLQCGIALLVIGAALFIFILTPHTFYPASLIMGVGLGFIAPAVQTMIIDLVPHSRRGTANSTYFIALDIGSGIGMLLGGFLADCFNYTFMFTVGFALVFISWFYYKLFAQKDYNKKLQTSRKV